MIRQQIFKELSQIKNVNIREFFRRKTLIIKEDQFDKQVETLQLIQRYKKISNLYWNPNYESISQIKDTK